MESSIYFVMAIKRSWGQAPALLSSQYRDIRIYVQFRLAIANPASDIEKLASLHKLGSLTPRSWFCRPSTRARLCKLQHLKLQWVPPALAPWTAVVAAALLDPGTSQLEQVAFGIWHLCLRVHVLPGQFSPLPFKLKVGILPHSFKGFCGSRCVSSMPYPSL